MYFRTRVQIPAPPPPFFNRISYLQSRSLRLHYSPSIFPKEFSRVPEAPGASIIFFNRDNEFSLSFPSPPLILHESRRRRRADGLRLLMAGRLFLLWRKRD